MHGDFPSISCSALSSGPMELELIRIPVKENDKMRAQNAVKCWTVFAQFTCVDWKTNKHSQLSPSTVKNFLDNERIYEYSPTRNIWNNWHPAHFSISNINLLNSILWKCIVYTHLCPSGFSNPYHMQRIWNQLHIDRNYILLASYII